VDEVIIARDAEQQENVMSMHIGKEEMVEGAM
jgi:hypothetical protein